MATEATCNMIIDRLEKVESRVDDRLDVLAKRIDNLIWAIAMGIVGGVGGFYVILWELTSKVPH